MSIELNNIIKEIDFSQSIAMFNTVTFLSYALDEHNFSYDKRLLPHEVKCLRYSSILLAIAGGHYSVLDTSRLSESSDILVRYSDWIFTTPLLLMTLTSYYELSNEITRELVIYNLLMIVFGFIYELTNNYLYWFIGTASYLKIIYNLYHNLPEKDLFYKYFVFGWSSYGIISLLSHKNRIIPYNIMDSYNKLIFAMEIRHKIMNDITDREKYERYSHKI
jgi:bacteriorhodopsin